VVDDRAAGREHHRLAARQEPRQHLLLEPAVVGLSVELEDLAEAETGRRLDLLIDLHERHPAVVGELLADRRLAGAAHAEERDHGGAPVARDGAGEDLGGSGRERLGDLGEAHERDVALAGLELGEKALGNP
jgi:hypothetical protein